MESPVANLSGQEAQIAAVRAAFDALKGPQSIEDVRKWLRQNFPDLLITDRKVGTYLRGCSVNNPVAISYHPSFPHFLFKRGFGEFELYNEVRHGNFDGRGYAEGKDPNVTNVVEEIEEIRDLIAEEVTQQIEAKREFAYESHLRDFLARNLAIVEDGLSLWTGSPDTSVEYQVGAKRVDILARDQHGTPVVIELKLSRGHERTVGQALFYRAKLKQSLGITRVRIIMIAGEITEELRLASSEVQDVQVFAYTLKLELQKI